MGSGQGPVRTQKVVRFGGTVALKGLKTGAKFNR